MISFVIGALVTVFTFYIALIYSSVTIGLLGFAEAILLVLAFLFLLWYRRKIEADIQIPIAVAPDGKRLSKREKGLDMVHLRQTHTPEALIGRLAKLAGLTETDMPIAAKDLIPCFSWEKIGREPVIIPATF